MTIALRRIASFAGRTRHIIVVDGRDAGLMERPRNSRSTFHPYHVWKLDAAGVAISDTHRAFYDSAMTHTAGAVAKAHAVAYVAGL